jgi:carbamoyl-phosphate synthase large subunit
VLQRSGLNAKLVPKIGEGKPDIIDLIKGGQIDLVINVPAGKKSLIDSKPMRSAAVSQGIPYITTLEAAQAAMLGLISLEKHGFSVQSIQDYAQENRRDKNRNYKHDLEIRMSLWK